MMSPVRSTVRIDDDLFQALKARAEQDGTSLTRTLNTLLRQGLSMPNEPGTRKPFEQRVVSLGGASFDISTALTMSASLEDEAILEKLATRK